MRTQCHTGLAGRVVAIANGLHLFGSIQFGWAVNRHCPCDWQDLFQRGIDGVEFVNLDIRRGMTRIDRVPIDMRMDGVDYGQIIDLLPGSHEQYDCAIIARFHRHKSIKIGPFIRAATMHCSGRVFILADMHRAYIADTLRKKGLDPIMPESPEMTHDFDRSEESVLRFARDWKTALSARKIITHEQPSGLTIPALNAVRIQS